MNTMKLEEKIKFVADHYGLDNQLNKLAEECAAFSAIRIKNVFFTSSSGFAGAEAPQTEKAMISKLSDVLTLTREIEYLLESRPELKNWIESVMNKKLKRQIMRIGDEKRS